MEPNGEPNEPSMVKWQFKKSNKKFSPNIFSKVMSLINIDILYVIIKINDIDELRY